MTPGLELFSVVAVVQDLPEDGLVRGQVGTVVELLSPSLAIVEFADEQGQTYAFPTLQSNQLMVLHYQRVARAA